MLVSSELISSVSNSTNFLNLAFFICQLFIDGKFRRGHILYEPETLDDRFLLEIESFCPGSIPWQKVDVTKPSKFSWNRFDSIDNVLQLIFFDPIRFVEKIIKYSEYGAYYQVIIFTSTYDATVNINMMVEQALYGNMLIVLHNTKSGLMQIQWLENVDGIMKGSAKRIVVQPNAVDEWNEKTDSERDNLFDRTFGVYQRHRTIAIDIVGIQNGIHRVTEAFLKPNFVFILNYYHTTLAPSLIHATNVNATQRKKLSDEIWILEQRKYYKELITSYSRYHIHDESKILKLERMDALHFGSNLVNYQRENPGNKYPLYPFHSVELKIVFRYGRDYPRHMNILLIPESVQVSAGLIMSFILLTSIILCIIRKTLKLRRSDFCSAFIDTMIPFIGGGNIRMDHKLEKWLFGILFVGAFFLTSLFAGDFLDCIYLILNQEITTFDQLAELVELGIQVHVVQYKTSHFVEIDSMLRTKLGPNVEYVGRNNPIEDAIICVIDSQQLRQYENHLRILGLDFDILPENLGAINVPYYLETYRVVPERQLNKINKVTSSLLESGLYRFYSDFANFRLSLSERTKLNREDVDDYQPLSMQQLTRPLILFLGLWALAIASLVVEYIIYKVNYWRGCRVHYLDRRYKEKKPKRLFRKRRGQLSKKPKLSDIELSNLEQF